MPLRASTLAGVVLLTLTGQGAVTAEADERPTDAGDDRGEGRVRAALETLSSQLVQADRNMRRAAARSVEALGTTGVPVMAEKLAHLRPLRSTSLVLDVLARVRAATDADAPDRLDAVLDLSPEEAGPGYAETVVTLSLIRPLAKAATPESVLAFARVATDDRGAFALDVTRHLAALGERATAGLILMSHDRVRADEKWATSELEALGKRTPGDAVQTKSKEVLKDVLLAYGTTHDADALQVVISFMNADRTLVRDAARESLTRYGEDGLPKLRESYGLLMGEAPPPEWPSAWLRRKLFDALDRIRLEDVDARVHAGLVLAAAGNFAEAVAAFDDVLARQPEWDRKGELVPAYVFYAETMMESDPKRAAGLLERALSLDPGGPRSAQIESALALLEGRALRARGITDLEPFRRALAKDPGNAMASLEVARMLDERHRRTAAWERRLVEGGVALAVASLFVLFAGSRRKRRGHKGRASNRG